MWVCIIQYLDGLHRTKGEGRMSSPLIFSASLLAWDISSHLLLLSDYDLHIGFPASQAVGLQLK